MLKVFILTMFGLSLLSCTSSSSLTVVPEVDLNRYAGTWYAIARFPHRFERDLDCVSATYTLRPDGRIGVFNQGRKKSDPSVWKSIRGVAWVPDPAEPGKLRVRFFWPFYGSYWILDLDQDYQWAMVGHPSKQYFWILSRNKHLNEEIIATLTEKARLLGFNTDRIQRVNQDCDPNGSIPGSEE